MEGALRQLKSKPLIRAGSTATYDDMAMFYDAVSILAFAPNLLPRMIAAVTAAIANGSGQLLYDSDLGAIIGMDSQALSSSAMGQYYSVLCTDDQFVTVSQLQSDLAKVSPAFAPYLDETGELAVCERWPFHPRDTSDYSAVTSPVTTLLVSGSFDPLTSPTWAQQAASTLANGYWVEFPGLGHDEGASTDPCPTRILAKFMLSPSVPDTSCVQSMTVAFAAPAAPTTVVMQVERGGTVSAAQAAPVGFGRRLAMVSKVENLATRRHLQRRISELIRTVQ